MNTDSLKQLREETGCSIMACKKALDQTKGDIAKAREYLKKNYQNTLVSEKSRRQTADGIIVSYIHSNKRIGALVQLHCETDFVANTKEFQTLGQELALQVVAMDPKDPTGLLLQEYVRDPKKRVQDIIKDAVGKLGENISIARFSRFEL